MARREFTVGLVVGLGVISLFLALRAPPRRTDDIHVDGQTLLANFRSIKAKIDRAGSPSLIVEIDENGISAFGPLLGDRRVIATSAQDLDERLTDIHGPGTYSIRFNCAKYATSLEVPQDVRLVLEARGLSDPLN